MLFDTNCHLVVIHRMIEENKDYRFNPLLQEACKKNIAEYCTKIVATAKQNEELNGKVIDCLKTKFREGKLTPVCEDRMTEVLHEQALNYKLNPLLQTVCKPEIRIICKPSDDTDERGEVEECLKMAFINGKIISQECKSIHIFQSFLLLLNGIGSVWNVLIQNILLEWFQANSRWLYLFKKRKLIFTLIRCYREPAPSIYWNIVRMWRAEMDAVSVRFQMINVVPN